MSAVLSEKDQIVLDSIFNPLQLGGGAELDSWMIPTEVEADKSPAVTTETVELSEWEKKALQLEAEAILLAEQRDYDKSIELFSQAIQLAPARPNTYNNRAQVYRLHGGAHDERELVYNPPSFYKTPTLCNTIPIGLLPVALADLTKALELCGFKGATARNAFCQRGLLHRKRDDEAAREDFKQAASLGSAFARNQVRNYIVEGGTGGMVN